MCIRDSGNTSQCITHLKKEINLSVTDRNQVTTKTRFPLISNSPVSYTHLDVYKRQNLFLTGQNLNVHGALGVTLTAMLTCSEFVGQEYLAKKVGNA